MELDLRSLSVTDEEIAARNLESGRRSAWARFARDPRRPGAAEAVVEHERLAAAVPRRPGRARPSGGARLRLRPRRRPRLAQRWSRPRSLRQRIASPMPETTSRGPRWWEEPRAAIERHKLTIDQACGVELEAVLAARRRIAAASGRLEDLVPLGAVLADLERFAEADVVYRQAFDAYDDVSPFPLALGLLSTRHALGRARAVSATRIVPHSRINAPSPTCRAM